MPSPSQHVTMLRNHAICMVSRDIRRAARCAHNAPNSGKRAFGPHPRGVHAAAADFKGRCLFPSRIPKGSGKGFLQQPGAGKAMRLPRLFALHPLILS